jgi:hypothetical protein
VRVRRDAHGGAARIACQVLRSDSKRIGVGDESNIVVLASGKSPDEVVQGIAECTGPKRSRLVRAIGGKGVCQGVDFIATDHKAY